MPFSNPIIGGSGALVYPSIKSPNFNQVAQTGWAIQKDGQAYFYDVTVTGQYVGTNFIINSLGVFFYNVNVGSGVSGANQLALSIVPPIGSSVTDPYGNNAPAGTTNYEFVPGVGYFANNTFETELNVFFNSSSMSSWPLEQTLTQINANGSLTKTAFNVTTALQASSYLALQELTGVPPTWIPVSAFLYSNITGTPQGMTVNGQNGTIPLVLTDVSTNTLGNTTTSTDLTVAYAPPASDGNVGTTYDLECVINGTWESGSELLVGIMLNGSFVETAPLTAGFAAGDNFTGSLKMRIRVITTGSSGTINIEGSGSIQDGTATRTTSTGMPTNGIRTAIAYNTTVTNTIAIAGAWHAAIAGQTVSGIGSSFTRTGP